MGGLLDDPDYWNRLGGLLAGPGGPLEARPMGLLGEEPGVHPLPMAAVGGRSLFGTRAYHGSPDTALSTISASPPSRQFDNGTSALGAFFAPAKGGATRYAGKTGRIYSADVNLSKPYEMPVMEFLRLQDPTTARNGQKLPGEQWAARLDELKGEGAALRQKLEAEGYDGVLIHNSKGELMEIASFKDVPVKE